MAKIDSIVGISDGFGYFPIHHWTCAASRRCSAVTVTGGVNVKAIPGNPFWYSTETVVLAKAVLRNAYKPRNSCLIATIISLMAAKFLCCLPLRLGVLIISFVQFLFAGAIAGLLWFSVWYSKEHENSCK